MTQALIAVQATLIIALVVALVAVERARRAQELEAWNSRNDAITRAEESARARGNLAVAEHRREHADQRVEDLQLELARRREGPILEGETVALTTPGDRTIRGVVRQTFDNGAILLGAATVYVERAGRDGVVEVEELDAGDVVVPEHRWAQKLPPAPLTED